MKNDFVVSSTRRNSDARAEFTSLKLHFGECPHSLQAMTRAGACPPLTSVQQVLDDACPVQKLTMKRFVREWTEGGVLDLLDRHGRT